MNENTFFSRSRATSAIKAPTITALLYTLIVAAFVTSATPAIAQNTDRSPVYLAGSGNIPLDQHVQSLLEKSLGENQDLVLISDKQAGLAENAPIVTVGSSAFSRIHQANSQSPVLALLVEHDFLQDFAHRSPRQISGIYKGAPLIQQALIGKAILPQATRIALLATPSSAELYESLPDQLSDYKLEARLFVVDDDKQLIPTLSRALSYGDFLLAAPDNAIYNPSTIKHILLTAYRRNRIVIGPSRAYVKAGVLASGYAPFPAMAKMATDYLNAFFDTGKFPKPDYPPVFRVEINEQVARSLNIPLAPAETIIKVVTQKLQIEGEPGNE